MHSPETLGREAPPQSPGRASRVFGVIGGVLASVGGVLAEEPKLKSEDQAQKDIEVLADSSFKKRNDMQQEMKAYLHDSKHLSYFRAVHAAQNHKDLEVSRRSELVVRETFDPVFAAHCDINKHKNLWTKFPPNGRDIPPFQAFKFCDSPTVRLWNPSRQEEVDRDSVIMVSIAQAQWNHLRDCNIHPKTHHGEWATVLAKKKIVGDRLRQYFSSPDFEKKISSIETEVDAFQESMLIAEDRLRQHQGLAPITTPRPKKK